MNKNTLFLQSRIKLWMCILHLTAFLFLIMGIAAIYCNDNFRRGLLWLNAEKYEDSPALSSQLDSDIALLFSYVGLKDIFETDIKSISFSGENNAKVKIYLSKLE